MCRVAAYHRLHTALLQPRIIVFRLEYHQFHTVLVIPDPVLTILLGIGYGIGSNPRLGN